MTYRELQKALKQARIDGDIPKSFKLNQKKEILQAMWNEINVDFDDEPLYLKVVEVLDFSCDHTLALANILSDRDLLGEYNKIYNDRPITHESLAVWSHSEEVKSALQLLENQWSEQIVNDLLEDVNLHRLVT